MSWGWFWGRFTSAWAIGGATREFRSMKLQAALADGHTTSARLASLNTGP